MQWLREEAARRGITVLELQAELDAEEGKSYSDEENAAEETKEGSEPATKRDNDDEDQISDEEEIKELEKLGMGINENYKLDPEIKNQPENHKVKVKMGGEEDDEKFSQLKIRKIFL